MLETKLLVQKFFLLSLIVLLLLWSASLVTVSSQQKKMSNPKSALVVIAMRDFQDMELSGVLKGLQAHGFRYDLCGKEKNKEAIGKLGSKQTTAVSFHDVNVDNYDRVAFIGGPGARALANEKEVQDLARQFYEAKKVVGAICLAPTILANAGVLKGKKATVWDSRSGTGPEAHSLQEHGANFVPNTPVVVDGLIVTGRGPDAAEEFGKVFATM